MNPASRIIIQFFAILLIVQCGGADEGDPGMPKVLTLKEGTSSPTADIESLAWIAGSWSCEAFGGTAEEFWVAPAGGAMMGMFRLVKESEVAFYEILTIAEKDSSLVLRLKHFDSQLSGWEAKDESVVFPLVRMEEKAAYFDGLTFKYSDENTLLVYIAQDHDGDDPHITEFRYKRMP